MPATVAAGIALGLVATAGFTGATPSLAAQAAGVQPTFTTVVAVPSATTYDSPGADTIDDITAEARTALTAARAVLDSAATMTDDITAAGLDLGIPSTSIDTLPLREEVDRLEMLDILPVLMLPAMTDDTTAQTRLVAARVAELRERLEAAHAAKAAEEAAAAAAAAAAAEAQRQAEAAAAAAAALANANTVEGAKAAAAQMASADYGWGADQFSCLASLWQKESGWNYQAYNASSGATGIPQALPGSKMASAGADWQTSAATQIAWGLGYISARYGSPCSAWSHSQATNWY